MNFESFSVTHHASPIIQYDSVLRISMVKSKAHFLLSLTYD